jgi:hypothetical protein
MSKKQRLVIIIGALIASIFLLVPPYKRISGYPAGYGLLFAPNKRFSFVFDGILFVGIKRDSGGAVRVDTTTLAIQCLLVGVLASSAAMGLQRTRELRTWARRGDESAGDDGPLVQSFSSDIEHAESRSPNERTRCGKWDVRGVFFAPAKITTKK